MKNVKSILAAAVVAAGLGTSANAISLQNLVGSYLGPITIKYVNYDEGRLYDLSSTGTAGPITPSTPEFASFTDINGVAGTKIGSTSVKFDTSDSWGIFYITGIYANDGTTALWTPSANAEITGIYWGEQDNYFNKNLDGSTSIYGANAEIALFYDNVIGDGTNFTFTSGPDSTSINSATDGEMIISGHSIPLGYPGVLSPTEFVSTYSGSTTLLRSNGLTKGLLSSVTVTDPSSNPLSYAGTLNSQFEPDFSVEFTATGGQFGWTANSQDPMRLTAIPTPTAVWGGVMLAGFVGMNIIRRRRAE